MKVYVDLGAWTGKTVRARLASHADDAIFAFEPNPDCLASPHWPVILRQNRQVKLYPVAAWVRDEKLTFYRNPMRLASQSGTVMRDKVTGGVSDEAAVEVTAIDFPAWLDTHVAPGDYLTLKVDIEGAEYELLERLIETGLLARVNELLVEFHEHKMTAPGLRDRHEKLYAALRNAPLTLYVFDH